MYKNFDVYCMKSVIILQKAYIHPTCNFKESMYFKVREISINEVCTILGSG